MVLEEINECLMKGSGNYGKLVVFDIEDNGRQIGEKMLSVLTSKQKKELLRFMCDIENDEGELKSSLTNMYYLKQYYVSQRLDEPFTELHIGALYLCLEQRKVRVNSTEIHLTVKEFDFLAILMMNPKRVFTYEMLMDLVWHEDYTFYSRKAINNHASNLRKKLKIAPDIPDYVKSVYGIGYKFEV